MAASSRRFIHPRSQNGGVSALYVHLRCHAVTPHSTTLHGFLPSHQLAVCEDNGSRCMLNAIFVLLTISGVGFWLRFCFSSFEDLVFGSELEVVFWSPVSLTNSFLFFNLWPPNAECSFLPNLSNFSSFVSYHPVSSGHFIVIVTPPSQLSSYILLSSLWPQISTKCQRKILSWSAASLLNQRRKTNKLTILHVFVMPSLLSVRMMSWNFGTSQLKTMGI